MPGTSDHLPATRTVHRRESRVQLPVDFCNCPVAAFDRSFREYMRDSSGTAVRSADDTKVAAGTRRRCNAVAFVAFVACCGKAA